MSGKLDGKVALITGGASGMGRGTVELFLAEGARVVVADIDDELGRALSDHYGENLLYQHCDITIEDDIANAIAKAESVFGGLDILFNNAGTPGPSVGVNDMTVAIWDKLMALLVRGPMLGIKHAVPALRRRGGGAIVNTASVASFQAGCGPLAYATGKAAVIQLTRCTAAELAQFGIRVNAICPGVIITEIFAKFVGVSGAAAEHVRAMVADNAPNLQPLKRAGLPEDIARACLYLASDDSAFVTGTYIVVDGGLTVGDRHSWDPNTPSPPDRMGFTAENIAKLKAGEKP